MVRDSVLYPCKLTVLSNLIIKLDKVKSYPATAMQATRARGGIAPPHY
jgi:hypothetical protein